jgi:hypothetical protein
MRRHEFDDAPILPPPPAEAPMGARAWLLVEGAWWEAERAAGRERARILAGEIDEARP